MPMAVALPPTSAIGKPRVGRVVIPSLQTIAVGKPRVGIGVIPSIVPPRKVATRTPSIRVEPALGADLS